MTSRANDFGELAFTHLKTGQTFELYARQRYNRNLNIYASAWRVHPGIISAVKVEAFEQILALDVPGEDRRAIESACAASLNKLAAILDG